MEGVIALGRGVRRWSLGIMPSNENHSRILWNPLCMGMCISIYICMCVCVQMKRSNAPNSSRHLVPLVRSPCTAPSWALGLLSLYICLLFFIYTPFHILSSGLREDPGTSPLRSTEFYLSINCPDTRLGFFRSEYSQTETSFMSQMKSCHYNRITDICERPDCTLTWICHLCQIL